MILMRTVQPIIAACLIGLTATPADAQADKAARAEAISRIATEDAVAYVLQPFDPETRYDADCAAETGKNAEQCNAFVRRMKTEASAIIAAEESAVRAALAPAAADLAAVLATLSDADLTTIERNFAATDNALKQPLSEVADQLIEQPDNLLWEAASREEERLYNLFSALFDKVIADLMADPALQ